MVAILKSGSDQYGRELAYSLASSSAMDNPVVIHRHRKFSLAGGRIVLDCDVLSKVQSSRMSRVALCRVTTEDSYIPYQSCYFSVSSSQSMECLSYLC